MRVQFPFVPTLERLGEHDVSPEEFQELCTRRPIAVLGSPSLPMISLERPDVWRSVVTKAVATASAQWAADRMSKTLIYRASRDVYLNLERVLGEAGAQLDIRLGSGIVEGRYVDIRSAVISRLKQAYDVPSGVHAASMFDCASRAIDCLAQHVETPWPWEAERAAVISRLLGEPLPSQLEPYVQPWPDWPSWDYVLVAPNVHP